MDRAREVHSLGMGQGLGIKRGSLLFGFALKRCSDFTNRQHYETFSELRKKKWRIGQQIKETLRYVILQTLPELKKIKVTRF